MGVVAIVCDSTLNGGLPVHQVMDKYVAPIVDTVHALPWLIPARPGLDVRAIVERVDGVLLPGGWSNVEPSRFGQTGYPGCLHDPDRDAVSLPLVRAALDAGVPLLGVCRGLQEFNVALGGSLHQRVWELSTALDHLDADETKGLASDPYRERHAVVLTPGGMLARILEDTLEGTLDGLSEGVARDAVSGGSIRVNSLHGQAIDRLATGLDVEARSSDGLVEAVSVRGATAFVLAVQWHPEWRYWERPDAVALFEAFGAAVRAHATTAGSGANVSERR